MRGQWNTLASHILIDLCPACAAAMWLTYAAACFAQAAAEFADEVWEPAAHTLEHNQQSIRLIGPGKQAVQCLRVISTDSQMRSGI